jgi:hypothetical protein
MAKLTLRTQKRLLLGLVILLAAGIAGVVAWAVRPPALPETAAEDKADRQEESPCARTAVGPLAIYTELAQRDLRRPLYDPVVVKAKPKPKPKPVFPGTLTGTVIEPGFSYATFRLPAGRDELVQLDEAIGDTGAVLQSVDVSAATILFEGEQLQLTVGGGS